MASQYDYIREFYRINIKRGMRVVNAKGKVGTIRGATNYVRVRLDGERFLRNYHPHSLAYPELGINEVRTP